MPGANSASAVNRTSLPLGWYIFFGIVEPISVLAGCVYTIAFQETCHSELVPAAYVQRAAWTAVSSKDARKSAWSAAGAAAKSLKEAVPRGTPDAATRMALAQLGSCYFLIMLNSALMFYAIRRWFSQAPVAQERVLYYLFVVLGLADWTHILLTIFFLPDPAGASNAVSAYISKLVILATDWSVWNSLLFGNIVITFLLFCARAAWWVGLGRHSFYGGSVPEVPASSSSNTPSRKNR